MPHLHREQHLLLRQRALGLVDGAELGEALKDQLDGEEEKQAIVVGARIVQPLGIADQRTGDRADVALFSAISY